MTVDQVIAEQRTDLRRLFPRTVWDVLGIEACETCGGTGEGVAVVPACCRRPTPNGECRGDCAVPEQVQIQCADCCGTGRKDCA